MHRPPQACAQCLATSLLLMMLAVPCCHSAVESSESSSSCYSGVARLRLRRNECLAAIKPAYFLTSPMDFSTDLPWDCLDSVIVSVDGCKLSLASVLNASTMVPDYSCSWIEYQGYIQTEHLARVSAWIRPVTTMKWIMYNTNLTSWRAQGTATLTFDDLENAIADVSKRDPTLALSDLLQQPEIVKLRNDSLMFSQQLATDGSSSGGGAAAASAQPPQQQPPTTGARRLLQEQPQQQQGGVQQMNSGATAPSTLNPAAAAAQTPATPAAIVKPPLPPGVEADVGNGLVSKPIAWQKQLADLYKNNGSPLIGIPQQGVIVLFNNERCNLTYEVVSGGLLGVGNIDENTVGVMLMPAMEPYQSVEFHEVGRAAAAAGAGTSASAAVAEAAGGYTGAGITLLIVLSVLGAALIGGLIYLAVKLVKAPKAAAAAAAGQGGAAFGNSTGNDGIAMSPLEHQARAHGPQGGI